jgi:HD-GYP domain-containing protein (c-di-GMP phosphodiesterase class II)
LFKVTLYALVKKRPSPRSCADRQADGIYPGLSRQGRLLPVIRESLYLLISFGAGGAIYALIEKEPYELFPMKPAASFNILALLLCVLIILWVVASTRDRFRKTPSITKIQILPFIWPALKLISSIAATEIILTLITGGHLESAEAFLSRKIPVLLCTAIGVFILIALLNEAERLNEQLFNNTLNEAINFAIASGTVAAIYALTIQGASLPLPVQEKTLLKLLSFMLFALIVCLLMHLLNIGEKIITEKLRMNYRYFMKVQGIKLHLTMLVPLGLLIATAFKINPETLILLTPIAVMYMSLRDYSQIHREALSTIEDLAIAFESRDPFTRSHSENVAQVAGEIAREMYLEDEEIEKIISAGKLHDLGKIGISDEILGKGKFEALTFQEYEEIRKHPEMGRQITGSLSLYEEETKYILYHHEWYNGSGYPEGLIGEQIPIGSRILAVAEAFDYMTSQSAYRDPIPLDVIVEEMKKKTGTQFDPEVVNALVSLVERKKHKEAREEPPEQSAEKLR